MLAEITALLVRDLGRLKSEIQKYPNEADLWISNDQISNSGGNLVLHLLGNLNHFIGATLGNTGYVRQRELEFSQKNVPIADLEAGIDACQEMIKETLAGVSESQANANFPIEVFGKPTTIRFFMIHLQGHLNYHMGQINYHRRLLAKA